MKNNNFYIWHCWQFTLYYAIILLILFGLSSIAKAKPNCSKHPIYCQIKANKPSISAKYAMKLSNVIHKVSQRYRIDARVYTAILAQESSYVVSAKNCHTGMRNISEIEIGWRIKYCIDFENGGDKCLRNIQSKVRSTVCTDFGISQIHYSNLRKHNFDIDKLTSDMRYSVEAGAIILSGITKRYSKREKAYWTRYNAGNKLKRKQYQLLVEKFL